MYLIRPWLFIGAHRDALSETRLKLNSIQAMLNLESKVEHSDITSLYLYVEDMAPIPPEVISTGVKFINEQTNNNHRLLITCGAGINRSAAFCIAALKEVEGLDLIQAYKTVRQGNPDVLPNKPIWESICEYYQEDASYFTVMKIAANLI